MLTPSLASGGYIPALEPPRLNCWRPPGVSTAVLSRGSSLRDTRAAGCGVTAQLTGGRAEGRARSPRSQESERSVTCCVTLTREAGRLLCHVESSTSCDTVSQPERLTGRLQRKANGGMQRGHASCQVLGHPPASPSSPSPSSTGHLQCGHRPGRSLTSEWLTGGFVVPPSPCALFGLPFILKLNQVTGLCQYAFKVLSRVFSKGSASSDLKLEAQEPK